LNSPSFSFASFPKQILVLPTHALVVIAQYCDGAYISKGRTNNNQKMKKNEKKIVQKSFIIPMDNCQTLVILEPNC